MLSLSLYFVFADNQSKKSQTPEDKEEEKTNEDQKVPLAKKKNLTNNKKTKTDNKRKRKIHKVQEEDISVQKGETKVLEKKQVKRVKKAVGWKGWVIVEEQELVKDEPVQEEQSEEDEGNVRKSKRTKRKKYHSFMFQLP
ncbi:hypothetical protein DFH28DRAFT_932567 [Melampsora americana]|nr:hypothetical protein DFH28DRAFT_932567 [Melampsora americana]